MIKDLHRLIAQQNIEDPKELQAFLNTLVGKKLTDFKQPTLSPKQQAEDMIEEAAQLSSATAKRIIEEALRIYPDCIEAYELLARIQKPLTNGLKYIEKAIEIGERLYGGEFEEKNKGHFWQIHETRPYMRCLAGKATLLYLIGKKDEGILIQERMLMLNPDDNQGVRDELSLRYVEMKQYDKFLTLYKQYVEGEDGYLSTCFAYNRVLCEFKIGGDTEAARESLTVALEINKFVPKKIAAIFSITPPNYYSPGNADEAAYYCVYAQPVWKRTPGVLDWMNKQVKKMSIK